MGQADEFLQEVSSLNHVLTVTFESLKDTKLLMYLVLRLNDLYKEVLTHFDGKKGLDTTVFTKLLEKSSELSELSFGYEKGPKSFRRQEDYVVCAKNYKVQIISSTSVKEYLNELTEFLLTVRD